MDKIQDMYYMRGLERFFEHVSDLEKDEITFQRKIVEAALDTNVEKKDQADRRIQRDIINTKSKEKTK
mgnify:CR=1 FL=1